MENKKIRVVAHFKKEKIDSSDFKGIKWTRVENEGCLHYLKEDKTNIPIQFWKRLSNRPVKQLVELQRIKTRHEIDDVSGRGAVSYAAPLYAEILQQIPQGIIDKIDAFEVLIKDSVRLSSCDEITTVLYKKFFK